MLRLIAFFILCSRAIVSHAADEDDSNDESGSEATHSTLLGGLQAVSASRVAAFGTNYLKPQKTGAPCCPR
jgi:hypothetical protein